MPSLTTVPEIPHDRLPVSLDLSFDTSRFELACHDDKDTIRAKVNLNEFEITFYFDTSFFDVSILSIVQVPSTPLTPTSKTGHDDTRRQRLSISCGNIYSKLTRLFKYKKSQRRVLSPRAQEPLEGVFEGLSTQTPPFCPQTHSRRLDNNMRSKHELSWRVFTWWFVFWV